MTYRCILLTLGGADVAAGQLLLLEAINADMQVRDDMATVGKEDPLRGVLQALFDKGLQLLEEGRDVNDGARTDDVQATRVDQTGPKLFRSIDDFRHTVKRVYKMRPPKTTSDVETRE